MSSNHYKKTKKSFGKNHVQDIKIFLKEKKTKGKKSRRGRRKKPNWNLSEKQ